MLNERSLNERDPCTLGSPARPSWCRCPSVRRQNNRKERASRLWPLSLLNTRLTFLRSPLNLSVKEISKTNSNASSLVMPVNQRANEITSEIHDLIHLSGPLTEDSVLRTLNARFINRDYFVSAPLFPRPPVLTCSLAADEHRPSSTVDQLVPEHRQSADAEQHAPRSVQVSTTT